jgi:rod shape-determining protein MreD
MEMVKRVALGIIFILAAALLQSTVLSRFILHIHAIPDIALCILVYIAYVNGTMTGQLTGFFSGFLLDFLSAAPLGLHAFTRTLTGALAGFLKDTFYLDYFLLPMALCAGATIFKVILHFLLHLLFREAVPSYNIFTITLWVELGMNTLLAPLIFALLRFVKPLAARQKEKV